MFEQSFSLEKLSEFIGRETILGDVESWLSDGNLHIVFVSGDYGIGKTRLLQRLCELADRELRFGGTPIRLIDLYHFRHHSPEGLARAIFACFKDTDNEDYFRSYITAQRRLEAARAAGDSKAIREQLQKLLASCIEGVKKMSSERGILLLFDTAEQFVYPTGSQFAPAWLWLREWIQELPRGVVLFAGRAAAEALFLRPALREMRQIPLDFFTVAESRDYLQATAQRWSRETGLSYSFADEDAQRLHTLSQGRPILLAIFIELRMRDPRAFKDLSALEAENFEQKIIDYLLSLPELGETLKATGRAPKGINAELLARIRGIPLRAAKQSIENLKKMSFAKTFPEDDRVFLHDEMYALLEKYVYSDKADASERQTAAQAIHDFYKESIKQKDEELKAIFAGLTTNVDFRESTEPSDDYIPMIRALEIARQQLRTEFLFYRLRHQVEKGDRRAYQDDPVQAGLKNYYRFGHEAATSNNDEILIPLQIELTNFWLRLEADSFWKPFIEGLLMLREVWLKVATGQPYLEDIASSEKNISAVQNLLSDQEAVLHGIFQTWLGTGLVFAKHPDYDRAHNIFTSAIESLQSLQSDSRLVWFKNMVLSLVYRQRAYTRSIRGVFQDAIEDYKISLRYSRSINFYHEEATLRNDLGYAQMQAGLFQSAFENIWDGLQLRFKVASGHRIALSYSSLARYFIASGAYEEARKHAQYSIRIAGAVGFRRGLGFGHLAFAEATRRFAFSAQGPTNQAEYLKVAQDAIDIAIHLLDQMGERTRIIDANLEQACLYRDRVRIETESSKKEAWFEKSDKQFQEVAKAAEEAGITYRLVDAMCNRIWLGYYAEEMEHAEQAALEFETLEVLAPYWLKDGQFVDQAEAKKNPILWSRIGKYYVGRGMLALKKWKQEKKNRALENAARDIMLGMVYTKAFAEDHRGLREGRRTIYQSLARLNSEELAQFSDSVLAAEEAEKIPQRPSALQLLMKDHALWFAG